MQRNTALKTLNPVLGLLLLVQVGSGLLRGFLSRDAFGFLHFWGGMALMAVAAAHVVLNWNWVRANILRRRPAPGP